MITSSALSFVVGSALTLLATAYASPPVQGYDNLDLHHHPNHQTSHHPHIPAPIAIPEIQKLEPESQTRLFTSRELKLMTYIDQLFDEDQQRDQAIQETLNHQFKGIIFGHH